MLDLEFVRNSSWIYDILTSGIGLGVFVAVLGILLSSNNNVDLLEVLSVTSESKEQKEKIDRIRKKSRTKKLYTNYYFGVSIIGTCSDFRCEVLWLYSYGGCI